MDDWSLLPSRNAVSEPAPNHQTPMTTTPLLPDSPARVKRPQPAPITHARNTRRLTRASAPGNQATNPGQSPKTPYQPRRSMPHRNQSAIPKVKNPEPRLDITRPFMDDIGATLRTHLGRESGLGTVVAFMAQRSAVPARPAILPSPKQVSAARVTVGERNELRPRRWSARLRRWRTAATIRWRLGSHHD